jgi:hypothetical protein
MKVSKAAIVETAVRGALITYGVAAVTWLLARTSPAEGTAASTRSLVGMMSAGLALQVLWWLVRKLIARTERDADTAAVLTAQAHYVFEMLVDGVTILLFALATFAAISGSVDAL